MDYSPFQYNQFKTNFPRHYDENEGFCLKQKLKLPLN
jgi:hypothetical protein